MLTADKAGQKFAYRHSGYPGGLKQPELRRAAGRPAPRRSSAGPCGACCPKNTLGRQQLAKLKVYAGPDHPHAAQNPEPLDLPDARRPPERR